MWKKDRGHAEDESTDDEKLGIGFWSIAQVLSAVWFIAEAEVTIRKNNVGPGEDVWGFGQIVALLPVLLGMATLVGNRLFLFLDTRKQAAAHASHA